MHWIKSLLPFLCAAALCLPLTACGDNAAEPSALLAEAAEKRPSLPRRNQPKTRTPSRKRFRRWRPFRERKRHPPRRRALMWTSPR